jgi:hypothetical protein
MDVDYNENDHSILPSVSDIIKSYSAAKAMHPTLEPMTPIDFDKLNNYDFQPLDNLSPEVTIAPPIHELSTIPTILLEPTPTGPIPQIFPPPIQHQNAEPTNLP